MVDREKPQMVLFLGDGERDWSRVTLPQGTAFAAVCGNCDWMAQEPAFRTMDLFGMRVFLTHGHLYSAKQGIYGLLRQAQQREAHMVLYGHTHRAGVTREGGCVLLCPGSMSYRDEHYAILMMEEGKKPQAVFRCLSDETVSVQEL